VACEPIGSGNERECEPEVRALERQARSTCVGIRGGRDENDD
jgi:hypothetical protein